MTTSTERMRVKRARDAHDHERDIEAERGARLISAEKRARGLEDDEDSRVDRAIAYAQWLEESRDTGQPWEGLDGENREQAIRDHFGYTASETRTQAERAEVARRIGLARAS
jgi:hypothetical protein